MSEKIYTKEKRYWKVKYGYNVSDQVSIEEKDLEKAIYSQIKGIPVQLGNSYIKGSNIISITPHWHKHTYWEEWYEPKDGDDWKQIKRDCPNYDGILEEIKARVHGLIKSGRIDLIGKNEDIKKISS